MQNESTHEGLDRPASPDEPEQLSKGTAQKRPKQHFGFPIGGTAIHEKHFMEEAFEEAGGWTQDVDLNSDLETAGVDEDPLVIDPPGSGGPFDALKFPAHLIQQLNCDDGDKLVEWGEKALLEIPD